MAGTTRSAIVGRTREMEQLFSHTSSIHLAPRRRQQRLHTHGRSHPGSCTPQLDSPIESHPAPSRPHRRYGGIRHARGCHDMVRGASCRNRSARSMNTRRHRRPHIAPACHPSGTHARGAAGLDVPEAEWGVRSLPIGARDVPAKLGFGCQHVWELSPPGPDGVWVRCRQCGLAMLTAVAPDRATLSIIGLVMPQGMRLPTSELDRARHELAQMIAELDSRSH